MYPRSLNSSLLYAAWIVHYANMSVQYTAIFHYANMSVQYAAIFHGCKNGNFHMKKNVSFYLIFALNIDCGYTLEPPQ